MNDLTKMVNNCVVLNPSHVNSLGHHSYDSLLQDDYGTTQLNFLAKARTFSGGMANFKIGYDYLLDKSAQEVELQFPYRDLNLWARIRPQDYQVHVDFGEFELMKKFRYYANVKRLEHGIDIFRIGAIHHGRMCQANTKLKHANKEVSLTSRVYYREQDIALGFAGAFNLTKNTPKRYDFLVGYMQPDFDIFLRHYSTNQLKLDFGRILGNVVLRQKNKQTYGVEVEVDENQNTSVSAGAAALVNGYILKAKANLMKQEVFFSIKGKLDDQWQLTLAGQLPLGTNYRNTTKLPFPMGLTLETTL